MAEFRVQHDLCHFYADSSHSCLAYGHEFSSRALKKCGRKMTVKLEGVVGVVAVREENQMAIEPWLRGTLTEVGAVQRAVLHAFEMAAEDLELWCGPLTEEELNARPYGIA